MDLEPENLRNVGAELTRIGFPHWQDLLPSAKPCDEKAWPTGSFYLYDRLADTKTLYTFVIKPGKKEHGLTLWSIQAEACLGNVPFEAKVLPAVAIYDSLYAPLPHKLYVDSHLSQLLRLHEAGGRLFMDLMLDQELKSLGFDLLGGSMMPIAINEPFAVIRHIESIDSIPQRVPALMNVTFFAGPLDHQNFVRPVGNECSAYRLISIQVGLNQNISDILRGHQCIVEKTYVLGEAPFPNKTQMIHEIRQEALQIEQINKMKKLFANREMPVNDQSKKRIK